MQPVGRGEPHLLRQIVQDVAEPLMGAEVDVLCGAATASGAPNRSTAGMATRGRDWNTPVGTIELALPKLRVASHFPDWLLQPRRRVSRPSSRLSSNDPPF
jgi:putative transposase